jgi:hypothetical protein
MGESLGSEYYAFGRIFQSLVLLTENPTGYPLCFRGLGTLLPLTAVKGVRGSNNRFSDRPSASVQAFVCLGAP